MTFTSTIQGIQISVGQADHDTRRDSGYGVNENYTTLPVPLKSAPPVIAFFSFLDPTSHNWSSKLRVVDTIRKSVSSGTEVSRYHATLRFAWDLGELLTHAWAVAKHLHVDDKIIEPLFDGVRNKTIVDYDGIRAAFDSVGIPPDMLLKAWGHNAVLHDTAVMDQTARRLGIRNVPCIVVKGKYLVRADVFGEDVDGEEVAKVVKELLQMED